MPFRTGQPKWSYITTFTTQSPVVAVAVAVILNFSYTFHQMLLFELVSFSVNTIRCEWYLNANVMAGGVDGNLSICDCHNLATAWKCGVFLYERKMRRLLTLP